MAATALCSSAGLTAYGFAADGADAASKPSTTLTVLVTNDDGVTAPGINATVQALSALPHTKVIGGRAPHEPERDRSEGDSRNADGHRRHHGERLPGQSRRRVPRDTIIWAIDDHGIAQRPDLVVSGINFGENIGPLASLSGTVGAAQTALARGIPALAVSQGVDNGQPPNFSQGAKYLVAWVQAHRKALLAAKKGTASTVNGNLNVPTCATGHIRGPVNVKLGTTLTGYSVGTVNCTGTVAKPANDVQAFVDGFASLTALHPVNPPQ